jgi:hypothetical protein
MTTPSYKTEGRTTEAGYPIGRVGTISRIEHKTSGRESKKPMPLTQKSDPEKKITMRPGYPKAATHIKKKEVNNA